MIETDDKGNVIGYKNINMFPDDVETIIMTRQDYDRHMENLIYENERLNNIINEIKDNCNDKTKDKVYLKMSKESLVNIINQKRNCIGYLRIERDKCFNIINELEKFLKINSEKDDYDLTEYNKGVNNAYNYILDKLKELKED